MEKNRACGFRLFRPRQEQKDRCEQDRIGEDPHGESRGDGFGLSTLQRSTKVTVQGEEEHGGGEEGGGYAKSRWVVKRGDENRA